MYLVVDKKGRYLKIDGSSVYLKSPLLAQKFLYKYHAEQYCPKDCDIVFLSEEEIEKHNLVPFRSMGDMICQS